MVIDIESDKFAEVQLNKINQIHKLNAINDQKFVKKAQDKKDEEKKEVLADKQLLEI